MTKRLLHYGIVLLVLLFVSMSTWAFQADRQINGKVLGKDNIALAGVSIAVKGSSGGTTTDKEGKFTITVAAGSSLIFSSKGYKTKEWIIGRDNYLEIQLEVSVSDLDEVVVIGYGTQKKSDVTAAISSVNVKNLEKQPAANVGTLLQGQASGVIVSTATGNPSSSPVILVRGMNSINNDRPLFVVDGIPLGFIYDINPNDVESVNILKDASAATIYGAQAAGGVILITTKKGKAGEPRINYNGYVSTHSLKQKFGLLDKVQTNLVVREAFANDGNPAPQYAIDDSKYANTDWRDAYFKQGIEQKHDIDLSAGNERMNYRISYGHWEHTGTVINSGSKRDNIRLNSELKLLKNRLKISPILSYTRFNNKDFGDVLGDGNAGFSDIMNIYATLPHKQIYDVNSSNGYAKPESILGSGNPVGERMLSRNRTVDDYFQMNISADLQILKGLSYNFSAGKTILNGYGYSQTNAYDFGPQSFVQNPSRFESRGRSEFNVSNHLFNIEQKFGSHNLKVLLGFSRQKDTYTGTSGGGNHLSSPLIEALSGLIIDDPADFIRSSGWNFGNTLQSYFGRLNYNYDEKYFFQTSIRRDGSSRFGSKNRYGTFYSFSAGWALHKEEFFTIDWLSELKPRISYGIVGNQNISNFQYLAKIFLNSNNALLNYPFGTLQSQTVSVGAAAVALANDNIKWEETATLNAGLSFGFLKNRITGSFDYFKSRTTDMLAETPIPASSGITVLPITNIADMENKGWEFTTTIRPVNTSEASFDITFNLSSSKNKIIRLGYDEGSIVDGYVDFNNRPTTITQKGTPLASFYLYKTEGIFQSALEINAYKNKNGDLLQPYAKPGDLRFVDVNGDGTIDDNDKVLMGNALPKLDFGITLNASYKNFDVSVFLNGKRGQKMYNGAKMFLYRQFRSQDLLNAWTPLNTNTNVYRLTNDDQNVNFRQSDYFLEDASFVRLRNIQFGFSVPQSLLTKAHLNRLRFYVGGFNLLTFTKYSGFDPDLSNNGIFSRGVDRGYYPLSKSYVAGINIGF